MTRTTVYRMRRGYGRALFIIVLMVSALFGMSRAASAHANLARSTPEANAILPASPEEIRLWLTEPLEPDYSRITLFDGTGARVETPASQVDSADLHQMFIDAPNLADGFYTVSWRALSAADGHPSEGTFPITVGAAVGGAAAAQALTQSIPPTDTFVRWVNFLSQALAVGSIGFWLFVWQPAVPEGDAKIERRMSTLIWLSWMTLGISGALLLMLQVALALDVSLLETINNPAVNMFVSSSRFGDLWLIRTAVWLGLGGALFMAASDRWFLWVALLMGVGTLLTTSLFSHASAAPTDSTAAVLADLLHLGATALWIGGLVQFVSVIGAVRKRYTAANAVLNDLVGYFSNFARVAVAGLFLTGLFATWLQINTLEALLGTLYGNLLLLKLAMFLPLLGIGAINLLLTHRGLKSGSVAWGARLRGLVGAEIVLTISILAVVGAMTSMGPGKTIVDARAHLAAQQIPPNPIIETLLTDDVNGQLAITPGYVGANTFTLTLTDAAGNPVENASRIRFLFRNLSDGGGDSELRFDHQGGGVYVTQGANIGAPGEWRLRATAAVPGDFDRLYDFRPVMELPPPAPVATRVSTVEPMPNRVPILLAVGLFAVAIGGFFLGESRLRVWRGAGFIAVGLLVVGVVFLASSLTAVPV